MKMSAVRGDWHAPLAPLGANTSLFHELGCGFARDRMAFGFRFRMDPGAPYRPLLPSTISRIFALTASRSAVRSARRGAVRSQAQDQWRRMPGTAHTRRMACSAAAMTASSVLMSSSPHVRKKPKPFSRSRSLPSGACSPDEGAHARSSRPHERLWRPRPSAPGAKSSLGPTATSNSPAMLP